MRQSEFKMKLDQNWENTQDNIFGALSAPFMEKEWWMSLNRLVQNYLERQWKKLLKKAVTAAATKTGEHVGKKAGDKIVQMLSKEKVKPPTTKKGTFNKNVETIPNKKITQQEINQRVNAILSGGKII